MPQTPHVEKHFTASETVRDIVIGMSDGLTVPSISPWVFIVEVTPKRSPRFAAPFRNRRA